MNRLLADLRIVELSAFVAAPLGGMTLAQMGAEVIRIDPIAGGIDFMRWPVTKDGASLKAKRDDVILLRLIGNRDGSAAVDYTVNAASGFPMVTDPGGAPINNVVPAWDIA